MSDKFGDIVANFERQEGAVADGFGLIAALAARYGVTQKVLLDELSGSSALAKIGRDLLGLHDLASDKKGRGSPGKPDESWRLFRYALEQRISHQGVSNRQIARQWVELNGGENPKASKAEAAAKRLRELDKRWGELPKLAALMLSEPPGPGHKSK